LAFLLVASATLCHGQSFRAVAQWDYMAGGLSSTNIISESNGVAQTNAVTRWMSRQGTALECLQEDWLENVEALKYTGGTDGYGFWPEAGLASNITIVAGIMVVKVEECRVRSALLTGERVVRLANRPGGGEAGHWDRLGPAEGVEIFVDQVPMANLQTGVWQIVTFVLPAEIPLHNAVVCGDPGEASWRRNFHGEVRHVTLLGGGEVSEPALRAMERVLAVRYQIPGIRVSSEIERAASRATQWHDYGQFPTLFIIK